MGVLAQPWAGEAAVVLEAVRQGLARGYAAAHTVSTVHYVVARQRDRATANTAVADLLLIHAVAPLGTAAYQRALAIGLRDFEDAVQAAAALAVDATFVVMRNERDFEGGTPGEIMGLLPTIREAPEDG